MAASKSSPTVVDKFKFYESEISTVFGFIVVVAIGFALLFFLRKASMKPSALLDLGASTTEENLMKSQSSPTPAPGTYVVQSGDHLWKIAESELQDGFQWTTIAKANNIVSPYVVRVGQTLKIPTADPTITAKDSQSSLTKFQVEGKKSAPMVTSTYTVKATDSLWKIAKTHYNDGYKWVQIYQANKSSIGSNPGVIQVGQRLTIPSL